MKYVAVLTWMVVASVAEPPSGPDSEYGAPSAPRPHSPSASGGGYGRPQFGGYGSRDEDNNEPANYEFRYDVDAPEFGTNFGHMESRHGDVAQGEYHVLLPDGRTQKVTYTADQDGYHPKISYEEGQGGYGRGPAQRGY